MASKRKIKKVPAPKTVSSKRLASIAGRGIKTPSKLKAEEIRMLAASVLSQAKADAAKLHKPALQPEPVEHESMPGSNGGVLDTLKKVFTA